MIDDLKAWFGSQIEGLALYARRNPNEFLLYVFLLLSPFFLISAFFSYKLSKQLKKKQGKQRAQEKHLQKIKKRQTRKDDWSNVAILPLINVLISWTIFCNLASHTCK